MTYNRALFLDLDGTIIKTKSGETFPKDIDDWVFNTGILTKIKHYSDNGFIICIVTNQGGIQLGHTTHEIITNKLDTISKEIEQHIGAAVNYVYCPDMDSYHRKPYPGMAYTLALQLRLELQECTMVGDSASDEAFATNSGIGSFLYINDFTGNYK